MNPGFLGRVESLRGIAALMVAICHSQLVLVVNRHEDLWCLNVANVEGFQAIVTKILLIVFNGGAAVSLFFVISGLVLGLSLDKQNHEFVRNSASFILRRAFRIYPALILSLLFVGMWLPLIYPAPDYEGASRMFQPLYRVPEAVDFFANLFFFSNQLNPVIWTLKVEMEVALLLPVVHLMNRKSGALANLVILLLMMGLSIGGEDTGTGRWVFAFYLGLMLPTWGPWLVSAAQTSPLGLLPWLAFTLAVFASGRHLLYGTGYAILTPFIEGFCAMMILACIVYHRELKLWGVLDLNIVRVMGRISYSFYLFHFPIHYLVGVALFHLVSAGALFSYPVVWHALVGIVSVIVTFPLAFASYLWVEKIFIDAGKDLTRRMQPSPSRPLSECAG
jgi:peptidoglycan/LPS O-acetylase OafA/YrhL